MISVIVPVYKVEEYLNQCVGSIVDQTYQNLEILLVDDGSSDASAVLCDDWAAQDSRAWVIHKQNGGLSDARNAGLKAANGTLFGFVDSDDWIGPELYERLWRSIQETKSDISACAVKMVWEDGRPEAMLTVRTNGTLDRDAAQEALLRETSLKHPVWYKLYRADTIRDAWFEVGKHHEDVFWSYQVIGRAERVSLIDYEGYFYRQRNESIMGSAYSLKRLDALEASTKWLAYILGNFPELANLALVSVWESCVYHGQMILKSLRGRDRRRGFSELNKVKRQCPIRRRNYQNQKLSHRVWIDLARVSLSLASRFKNALRIGL